MSDRDKSSDLLSELEKLQRALDNNTDPKSTLDPIDLLDEIPLLDDMFDPDEEMPEAPNTMTSNVTPLRPATAAADKSGNKKQSELENALDLHQDTNDVNSNSEAAALEALFDADAPTEVSSVEDLINDAQSANTMAEVPSRESAPQEATPEERPSDVQEDLIAPILDAIVEQTPPHDPEQELLIHDDMDEEAIEPLAESLTNEAISGTEEFTAPDTSLEKATANPFLPQAVLEKLARERQAAQADAEQAHATIMNSSFSHQQKLLKEQAEAAAGAQPQLTPLVKQAIIDQLIDEMMPALERRLRAILEEKLSQK